MALLELNPRWLIGSRWDEPDGQQHFPQYDADKPRHGMGMSFDCPTHRTHRLVIFFANPVDGLPLESTVEFAPSAGKPLWNRTGDDFATMTISPSISAEVVGCWHGFITDGAIR